MTTNYSSNGSGEHSGEERPNEVNLGGQAQNAPDEETPALQTIGNGGLGAQRLARDVVSHHLPRDKGGDSRSSSSAGSMSSRLAQRYFTPLSNLGASLSRSASAVIRRAFALSSRRTSNQGYSGLGEFSPSWLEPPEPFHADTSFDDAQTGHAHSDTSATADRSNGRRDPVQRAPAPNRRARLRRPKRMAISERTPVRTLRKVASRMDRRIRSRIDRPIVESPEEPAAIANKWKSTEYELPGQEKKLSADDMMAMITGEATPKQPGRGKRELRAMAAPQTRINRSAASPVKRSPLPSTPQASIESVSTDEGRALPDDENRPTLFREESVSDKRNSGIISRSREILSKGKDLVLRRGESTAVSEGSSSTDELSQLNTQLPSARAITGSQQRATQPDGENPATGRRRSRNAERQPPVPLAQSNANTPPSISEAQRTPDYIASPQRTSPHADRETKGPTSEITRPDRSEGEHIPEGKPFESGRHAGDGSQAGADRGLVQRSRRLLSQTRDLALRRSSKADAAPKAVTPEERTSGSKGANAPLTRRGRSDNQTGISSSAIQRSADQTSEGSGTEHGVTESHVPHQIDAHDDVPVSSTRIDRRHQGEDSRANPISGLIRRSRQLVSHTRNLTLRKESRESSDTRTVAAESSTPSAKRSQDHSSDSNILRKESIERGTTPAVDRNDAQSGGSVDTPREPGAIQSSSGRSPGEPANSDASALEFESQSINQDDSKVVGGSGRLVARTTDLVLRKEAERSSELPVTGEGHRADSQSRSVSSRSQNATPPRSSESAARYGEATPIARMRRSIRRGSTANSGRPEAMSGRNQVGGIPRQPLRRKPETGETAESDGANLTLHRSNTGSGSDANTTPEPQAQDATPRSPGKLSRSSAMPKQTQRNIVADSLARTRSQVDSFDGEPNPMEVRRQSISEQIDRRRADAKGQASKIQPSEASARSMKRSSTSQRHHLQPGQAASAPTRPANPSNELSGMLELVRQQNPSSNPTPKLTLAKKVHYQASPGASNTTPTPPPESNYRNRVSRSGANDNGVVQRTIELHTPPTSLADLKRAERIDSRTPSRASRPMRGESPPPAEIEPPEERPRIEFRPEEIDVISRKVYTYIKRKLHVDRERRGKSGFPLRP